MSQITIGYTTEGTTDVRLLESIIQRTFEAVAFECAGQVEVITPIIYIPKIAGAGFANQVEQCCKDACDKGVLAFCVHVDADDTNDNNVFANKIEPAFNNIATVSEENLCKNLVAVVPVQMTEAWMLADKLLLKEEIGTDKTDAELGINKMPETFSNPKGAITEAIRRARELLVKRRRSELSISELYQPIGQKISLEKLEALPSYLKFKDAVREAYRKLNYLQ
jgi:hypothetical protein